jgi:hypothetical protein
MTGEKYEGTCRGGPWDGRLYVHWNSSLTIYKPMIELRLGGQRTAPVRAVPVGTYEFVAATKWWVWYPALKEK